MGRKKALRPRQVVDLRFPQLPVTLYGKARGKWIRPRLLASLPRNYTRNGRFPVLIYLAGGSGEAMTRKTLSYARRLTADKDFIAVIMPLFKKDLDADEIHRGLLLGAYDDYPLISRCYRTMLKALFGAIPNVDPERSVLGGFSNGAHTTALLLSAVDSFVLKHFGGFFLLDGGWHIASHHKTALKGKRIIYFVGGSRRRKSRRYLLDALRARQGLARTPNVSVVEMPGVEHAFPDGYISRLRKWIANGNKAEPHRSAARGKSRGGTGALKDSNR